MTKRCRFCGAKMVEAVISGENVWQCPVCEYVEKKPVEAVQADEEQKQD